MSNSASINHFIKWIQSFDNRLLKNEDDVEKKFAVPMFQYLGYPERCRQSKYPLKIYNSGTQERNLKIAQIYFSTDNIKQQNADTSLISVICLEPNTTNFQEAIEQAKFYNKSLKLLFLFVTNGYKINVFKCLYYQKEEIIFDTNTDLLININLASEFYNQLSFTLLKNIDKNINTNLALTKYINLEKALTSYPDLQNILSKSEFEPSIIREGNHFMMIKPKILIECHLPKLFVEGNCQIQFSSLILRGLKIDLNHRDILGKLMIGLDTQPDWGCRRFLKKLGNNAFEVYLGQVSVILSKLEITDLCLCVDAVCQEYKKFIIGFENILETWDFELVKFTNICGFSLFSVESKLWELMQRFANEFNYAQGKSEWHLFHQEGLSIRVSRGISDHAFILSKADSNYSENKRINIVYQINAVHLQSLERGEFTSWQQDIGPQGTWTAKYTKQWLLEKYIPKVIDYYSNKFQLSEAELNKNIINYQINCTPIEQVNDIKELVPYLRDIQSWLHIYMVNIAASLLRPYYQAFTDLVRNTDSAIAGIDYITGTLHRIEWGNDQEGISSYSINRKNSNFKDAIRTLDRQVARINNSKFENSLQADLITRTFIWIIEHGKVRFSQSQLNAAKQALLPLWEQSRFEIRHVYPNR
ncbi:type I restriction enzyme HsdR N-terminal domain-containing protein [Nostocales cyanobacterium LEGE 11386]|nr:type I restriction enzyme HsdR N-terminal domain-containing protein [Nostocales cyanobacterium LEGE 11386]